MKRLLIFSGAALALSTLPLAAQQAGAAVDQGATASATGVSASQSAHADAHAGPATAQANGSASTHAEMRPVTTHLVNKLDSKSAKAGDPIVVKTNEGIKTADGLVIPKGSRLIGHVEAAQAHASGQADSSLSLVFDRAEMKNGESVAIRSVIETVAPPENAIAADSLDTDAGIAAPIGGGARAGGGGRLGGGLLGGPAGATGSAASNLSTTAGGAASTLGATTAGAAHATTGIAGNVAAASGSGLHATTGPAGSLAAHATGIPGVMLAGDATGTASGTLTASRKNIHLDSGTQMVMGLSAAAAK